ncbi:DUF2764 family protein [bacterium]|nr:DUF2764 family protein [bacterium]
MADHYYLVAQLPMLFFDRDPGITTEAFLAEANKWMSGADYRALSRCILMDVGIRRKDPGLFGAYAEFERHFRQELAGWRKARRENQEYRPSFPAALVREGNPLEVEKKLLKHRWDHIDALTFGHHFDLDFLCAYYLKLQILDRLSLFDREKGMEIFKNLSRMTV